MNTNLAAEAAECIGTHTDIESSTAIIKAVVEKAYRQGRDDEHELWMKPHYPSHAAQASDVAVGSSATGANPLVRTLLPTPPKPAQTSDTEWKSKLQESVRVNMLMEKELRIAQAKGSPWKQSDPDYAPSVVVDKDNHYVSTAINATAAKLFIDAHNRPPQASEHREADQDLMWVCAQAALEKAKDDGYIAGWLAHQSGLWNPKSRAARDANKPWDGKPHDHVCAICGLVYWR